LDDGQILTENVGIRWWIAQRKPSLAPGGDFGGVRLLEMLAFISTEIHKQFGRIFKPACDAEAAAAREKVGQRFQLISKMMKGDYLFGDKASVAEAYLLTMLPWAHNVGMEVPAVIR
jgi:glutathione S-transferase